MGAIGPRIRVLDAQAIKNKTDEPYTICETQIAGTNPLITPGAAL
jgi:hypothetical protein